MPKVKPFGIGDVDDLVDAKNEYSSEVVPKGIYKAKVKRMTMGTINKAGENKGKTRFGILCEVVGGSKKLPDKYIGAGVWTGINVIKSGAGFCNDFINALAGPDEAAQKALRRSFWKPDILVDDEGNVIRIGKKKVGSPNGELVVWIKTKMGKDQNGDPRAEVQSFLLPKGAKDDDDEDDDEDEDDVEDADDDDEDDDDDDDASDDDDEDEDDEDSDDDEDEEDDDDEEDDEEDEDDDDGARKAELEALTIAKLRPIAKALDIDTKGLDKVALISSILEEEAEAAGSADDEDDEDEDEDDAESELREELEELSEIALRKRAKAAGAKLAQYKGKEKSEVIDLIVELELEDEEDDDEEPF